MAYSNCAEVLVFDEISDGDAAATNSLNEGLRWLEDDAEERPYVCLLCYPEGVAYEGPFIDFSHVMATLVPKNAWFRITKRPGGEYRIEAATDLDEMAPGSVCITCIPLNRDSIDLWMSSDLRSSQGVPTTTKYRELAERLYRHERHLA